MRREVVTFVFACGVGCLLSGESSVLATPTVYRTISPIDCQDLQGLHTATYPLYGVVENATANTMELWCAMPHDSYFPLTSTLTLTVSGENDGCAGSYCSGGLNNYDCLGTNNGTADLCARACRTYWSGCSTGGECGSWAGSTSSGVVHFNPSSSSWSNGTWKDSYYVDVFMCASNCGGSYNEVWAIGANQ